MIPTRVTRSRDAARDGESAGPAVPMAKPSDLANLVAELARGGESAMDMQTVEATDTAAPASPQPIDMFSDAPVPGQLPRRAVSLPALGPDEEEDGELGAGRAKKKQALEQAAAAATAAVGHRRRRRRRRPHPRELRRRAAGRAAVSVARGPRRCPRSCWGGRPAGSAARPCPLKRRCCPGSRRRSGCSCSQVAAWVAAGAAADAAAVRVHFARAPAASRGPVAAVPNAVPSPDALHTNVAAAVPAAAVLDHGPAAAAAAAVAADRWGGSGRRSPA
ncbi:hypothetical protein T492DRAFT_235821 [Pavlovales sp. CCMP2436]|nr:hypothetical protein T492DRAFT_235821 [Pavlovales sp. CCMP2436]|mmetsp:Transcript_16812/g.42940  ORF Transcript_16812/g.42940 Transcript_16812/m.42940 type:complete len:276 (-) Transcript_16812:927-1754(-)